MSPQLTIPELKPNLQTIALYEPNQHVNIAGVLRTAHVMGFKEVITINPTTPYKRHPADTTNATKHIDYAEMDMYSLFILADRRQQEVVPILQTGLHNLSIWTHPARCIYLFGNETNGLDEKLKIQLQVRDFGPSVYIPTTNDYSLNLATAASIVMYDRHVKGTPSE